jgi:glycosyltransferase involved in cell wall biosynthesis
MAFLQILTRVYRRPRMLWSNIRSLEAQTDPDWQQTMLVDGEGRGVGAAQAALANFAPYVTGEYVLILDDDDRLIRPTLVAEVKAIVSEHRPNVVMVKMDHRNGRVLPDAAHWQKEPQLSYIGCSAYIVKRQLWQRYAPVFGGAQYTSDFDFINAIFGSDADIYWHDVIASQVQRVSMGQPE